MIKLPVNLDKEPILAIDTETYCPAIKEFGHSFNRGGYIVGVSIATLKESWYCDIRQNENVISWLQDLANNFKGLLIGTNLQYDLLYFEQYNIHFNKCKFWDISIVDCLIDENQKSYSLDSLSKKYLNTGKVDEELYEWLAEHYGGKPIRKEQAGRIYLAPSNIVEKYAKGDVELPLKIYYHQKKIVDNEDLNEVLDVEMRLLPLLVKMRYKGIRVNVGKAQFLHTELLIKSFELDRKLKEYGLILDDVYRASAIAEAFERENIVYPLTEKTERPSFPKSFLSTHNHPLPKLLSEARKIVHFKDTFLEGYIIDGNINGRIHCQYNQLRGDDYGTITGRLSASYPNLQNIPARDPEYSEKIRSIFLPEPNEIYLKADYSQIEFRLFAHYSRSERLIKAYADNPLTDFHQEVTDILHGFISRKLMKNFNFMKLYGGGKTRTIEMLQAELTETEIDELVYKSYPDGVNTGISPYELAADTFITTYNNKFPEAKQLSDKVRDKAKATGYIKTLLGRKKRFNLWEPCYNLEKKPALTYDEAVAEYGRNIQRAFVYKALNYLCQGSAADIIKLAMIKLYEELGIVPLLSVHDELGISIADPKIKKDVTEIMETVVALKVPIKSNIELLLTWK